MGHIPVISKTRLCKLCMCGRLCTYGQSSIVLKPQSGTHIHSTKSDQNPFFPSTDIDHLCFAELWPTTSSSQPLHIRCRRVQNLDPRNSRSTLCQACVLYSRVESHAGRRIAHKSTLVWGIWNVAIARDIDVSECLVRHEIRPDACPCLIQVYIWIVEIHSGVVVEQQLIVIYVCHTARDRYGGNVGVRNVLGSREAFVQTNRE